MFMLPTIERVHVFRDEGQPIGQIVRYRVDDAIYYSGVEFSGRHVPAKYVIEWPEDMRHDYDA